MENSVNNAINFISSTDVEEDNVMHSDSGNIKFTPESDANDVIDKLFKSLCSIYQYKLETTMKESDSVQLLYYKCHKVNSSCGGSYIDSPDQTKKKKSNNKSKKYKENDFIFDSVQLLYYKCHKINLSHGGSYIHSPNQTKKKKSKNKSKIYRQ